jgi:H+/Cl- antiporter ClcA/PII-like signaling protein
MPFPWDVRGHLRLCGSVGKWLLIACSLGIAIGSAVALFLWSLERATEFRFAHPSILFALPLAGVAIGALYRRFGKSCESGNDLILEQIHEPGGGVPWRMAPLVLVSTVATHLFGGSAGREGTAVQMGGSLAGGLSRWLRLTPQDNRTLLMAGVAGGFGAVFGTPLTGAIFAMEVLAIGRMSYESLIPCLMASIAGDCTVRAWGLDHSHYHISSLFAHGALASPTPLSGLLLLKVAAAAIVFGLVSVLFVETTHGCHWVLKRLAPWPLLRPALGGCMVIALTYVLGTRDYLGLGTVAPPAHPDAVTIQSCFSAGGATPWSWWWKILFTAMTLGAGFKGGEVTPLFFVGAALGNVLAQLLGAPVDLFAGLGFVAVFAGATNTPLACTIMGLELFLPGSSGLFDSGFGVYLATACFLSYVFSGHSGIYLAQRIGTPKLEAGEELPEISLRLARELRPRRRSRRPPASSRSVAPLTPNGGPLMSHHHPKQPVEVGQLRIFVAPRDRRKQKGVRRFFTKPLYQEIIHAAKAHGLLNAVAHRTHYGFTGAGKVNAENLEVPNDNLTLCVELIAVRHHLESFCQKHSELLHGKVVVFDKLEHWEIAAVAESAPDDEAA